MARPQSFILAPLSLGTIVTNPCRLCPELDGYSDAECLRFSLDMGRARRRGLLIALVFMLAVGPIFAFAADAVVILMISERSAWSNTDAWQGRLLRIIMMSGTGVVILYLAMLPYCLLLRGEVRKRVQSFSCKGCSYSLIGLPVKSGAIICPECGAEFVLAENGFPAILPELHRSEPVSLLPIPMSWLYVIFSNTWLDAFIASVLFALVLGPTWGIAGASAVVLGKAAIGTVRMQRPRRG